MSIRLIQVRTLEDPIREHEQLTYRNKLKDIEINLDIYNILEDGFPEIDTILKDATGIIIGGAAFSLTNEQELSEERAVLERICHIAYEEHIPFFGVCYGHQVLSAAFGGKVIKDTTRAQNSIADIEKKEEANADPLFSYLPTSFLARLHHEDHVVELPKNATHLLANGVSPIQGFRLDSRPMYGVQFHPELNAQEILHRYEKYPNRYFSSLEERDRALVDFQIPDERAMQLLREFALYAKDCTEQKNK